MEEEADFRWNREDKDMNNREYLNTLSDEEFTDVIQMQMAKASGFDGYTNSTDFLKRWHNYLQSTHTTTADEDFAEIGFRFENITEVGYFYRKKERMAELRIWVDKKDTHYMSVGGWFFTDHEIDQIRTIADKKREELWWNK